MGDELWGKETLGIGILKKKNYFSVHGLIREIKKGKPGVDIQSIGAPMVS